MPQTREYNYYDLNSAIQQTIDTLSALRAEVEEAVRNSTGQAQTDNQSVLDTLNQKLERLNEMKATAQQDCCSANCNFSIAP